ncbi:MAG: hypothetical protein WC589_21880 [Sphingobacterium sp.]
MADVTATLQDSFRDITFNQTPEPVNLPSSNPTIPIISQPLEQPQQSIQTSLQDTFSQPVFNAMDLVQTLSLNLGDKIDFKTENLIETAAIGYMVSNDGRVPEPKDLANYIYVNYLETGTAESIHPDAQMVTDNITVSTNQILQNTSLPAGHWITEVGTQVYGSLYEESPRAELFTPLAEVGNPTAVMIVGEMLNTDSLKAASIVEQATGVFEGLGITPTTIDLVGLTAAVVETSGYEERSSYHSWLGEQYLFGNQTTTIDLIDASFSHADLLLRSETTGIELKRDESAIASFCAQKFDSASPQLIAAVDTFLNVLELRRPMDGIGFDNNYGVVSVLPNGAIRVPHASSYAVSSTIVGATEGVSDVRTKGRRFRQIPDEEIRKDIFVPGAGNAEYTTPFYVPGVSDPFCVPVEIKELAQKVRSRTSEPAEALNLLFDSIQRNGDLKIDASIFISDRQGGSLTPTEVLQKKKANCLESTAVFVLAAEEAFKNDRTVKVVALDVINTEERVEIGHACVGVLLESDKVSGHPQFSNNWEFRKKLLEQTGVTDSPYLKLLVIDPVNCIFDFRFDNVKYLDKKQLSSCFYSNSASYAARRRDDALEKQNAEMARKLWLGNPALLAFSLLHSDLENAERRLSTCDPDYINSNVYFSLLRLAIMKKMVGSTSEDFTKHLEDTLLYADKCLALNRNHLSALIFAASSHMALAGNKPMQAATKHLQAAINQFNRAIKVSRTRFIERAEQAEHALAKGAKEDVNKGEEKRNEIELQAKLYAALAATYFVSGQTDKCIETCEAFIERCGEDKKINVILAFATIRLVYKVRLVAGQQYTETELQKTRDSLEKKLEDSRLALERILEEDGGCPSANFAMAFYWHVKNDSAKRDEFIGKTIEQGILYYFITDFCRGQAFNNKEPDVQLGAFSDFFQMALMVECNPSFTPLACIYETKEENIRIPASFYEGDHKKRRFDHLKGLGVVIPEHAGSPKDRFNTGVLKRYKQQMDELNVRRSAIIDSDLSENEKGVLLRLCHKTNERDIRLYLILKRLFSTSAFVRENFDSLYPDVYNPEQRKKAILGAIALPLFSKGFGEDDQDQTVKEVHAKLLADPLSLDLGIIRTMTRMIEDVYPTGSLERYTKEVVLKQLAKEGLEVSDELVNSRVNVARRFCWQEKFVPAVFGMESTFKLEISVDGSLAVKFHIPAGK